VNVLGVWLSYRLLMGTVLAGLSLDIAAIGFTNFLAAQWFPEGTSGVGDLAPAGVNYMAAGALLVAAVAVGAFLRRTHRGLIVNAVGERAEVAEAFGVSPVGVRIRTAIVGGVFVGLGGGLLALVAVGSFVDNITSGRGFIALACVILCGWRPVGALLAAGVFGMTDALHFTLSANGQGAAGQILVVLPYVATIVAIGLLWGRARGPAEESMLLEPHGAER
jgi:simple sugar transport system permease protein